MNSEGFKTEPGVGTTAPLKEILRRDQASWKNYGKGNMERVKPCFLEPGSKPFIDSNFLFGVVSYKTNLRPPKIL